MGVLSFPPSLRFLIIVSLSIPSSRWLRCFIAPVECFIVYFSFRYNHTISLTVIYFLFRVNLPTGMAFVSPRDRELPLCAMIFSNPFISSNVNLWGFSQHFTNHVCCGSRKVYFITWNLLKIKRSVNEEFLACVSAIKIVWMFQQSEFVFCCYSFSLFCMLLTRPQPNFLRTAAFKWIEIFLELCRICVYLPSNKFTAFTTNLFIFCLRILSHFYVSNLILVHLKCHTKYSHWHLISKNTTNFEPHE